MSETRKRIDALDDKQAIHIVKKLVQAVFSTSPQVAALGDAEQLALAADAIAHLAGDIAPKAKDFRTEPGWAEAELPASAAGELAREALRSLAAQPGGDEMVARALDTWFDNQADFGILSGAAAIALVWMVCASDIEFTIGSFRFHKAGLSGAQQKALANALIPGVVRRLAGK